MEAEPRQFIPFVAAILIAIGALFMIQAGNEGGGFLYGLGLALFAIAFLFGLWAIRRFFDRIDRSRPHHHQH